MNRFALICPVCQSPLQQEDKRLLCQNNHSFDRARQGYWNLLLPQRKRSKAPGDSAEMVQTRQRFLEAGHYAPLAEAIVALLQPHTPPSGGGRLLDLGCGEGWYTGQLQPRLNLAVAGLDISKPAIRSASRRSQEILWLVVYPGPGHLHALRSLIYEQVRESSGFAPEQALAEYFEPVESRSLRFRFQLDSAAAVQDLLAMTPHGQRLNQAARERIAACTALDEQADFRLALFRRL